jgi:RecB family endonuclease NucS
MDTQLKRKRIVRGEAEKDELISLGYRVAGVSKRGSFIMMLRDDTPMVDAETADAIETTFGLERDLQRALRKNIEQLESGLKIVDGNKEQIVDSGRIDITAEDSNGTTVIIELKAGAADREAVAQILAYMGDLMSIGKPVRGILVAGDFPTRTIAAARAVPNLQLRKYKFQFSFEAIGLGVAETTLQP